MKLTAPTQSIDFTIQDINGNNLSLSDFKGQRVLLSFFRNAECPFCNFRIHEMTQRYREWRERGLEVIAVFVSSPEDVKRFVARRPRPFNIIGDPDLALNRQYGVEKSNIGLIKAMMLRIPTRVR
ncbi:MAG: peroxiredoxin family protein, partial [Candidatus Competibacterales bacterium]